MAAVYRLLLRSPHDARGRLRLDIECLVLSRSATDARIATALSNFVALLEDLEVPADQADAAGPPDIDQRTQAAPER